MGPIKRCGCLRGRGEYRVALCVASVALVALGLAVVARLGPVVAAAVWLAGVELSDVGQHFAWLAWHLWHWAGSGGALVSRLRGRGFA